jgi:hypothetical protein
MSPPWMLPLEPEEHSGRGGRSERNPESKVRFIIVISATVRNEMTVFTIYQTRPADSLLNCPIMIQTSLLQSTHADLVTDAAYDFYGLRLATCSLDQR